MKEKLQENTKTVTSFNYASCLVQSPYAVDVRKGISLFFQLLDAKEDVAFSHMDCAYFIALGKARLKVGIRLCLHRDIPFVLILTMCFFSRIIIQHFTIPR